MVNTVLGSVHPNDLGKTLIHEHIVFGNGGWEGDISMIPLDRAELVDMALKFLDPLKEYGVKTFVDATPNDSGRNVELLKEISEKSGINIICSTGYYFEPEGASAYFKARARYGDAGIYDLFMKEITEGIAGTGIKAGVIKVASSKGEITDYEKNFFKAAAKASKETGVPIISHTQDGTMGPEQAELLLSEGADPRRVMIGHMCDNLDISYQVRTLSQGVSVGFDRMGLYGDFMPTCPPDDQRCAALIGLIYLGYTNQIMISHDRVAYNLGRPMPMEITDIFPDWEPTHLYRNIVPRLKEGGVTEAQINAILQDNPCRLFGGE